MKLTVTIMIYMTITQVLHEFKLFDLDIFYHVYKVYANGASDAWVAVPN